MTFKIKNPNWSEEKLEETTTAVIGHDGSPDLNMTTLGEEFNPIKFNLNDISFDEVVILHNLLEKRIEKLEAKMEKMTNFLNSCEDCEIEIQEVFKDLILSLNKQKNTIKNLLQKFENVQW